jgi:hypothetical protein
MAQEDVKPNKNSNKDPRSKVKENESHQTFEPEPLADEVSRSTEFRPNAAAALSPVRTRPEYGKPTSAVGSSNKGFASDKPEPSQEQMTSSSPSGSPGSVGAKKKGEPT